jgi:hypothetical protein
MSANDKTGGPAFPAPAFAVPRDLGDAKILQLQQMQGMTLRDYFAAKAMQAAATNPTGADGFTFEQRAEWAYQQADAMLKAREQ